MKKLILLSALTLLAACGNNNTASPNTQTTTSQAAQTTETKKLEKFLSKDNSYSLQASAEWSNMSSEEDFDIDLNHFKDHGSIRIKSIEKSEVGLNLKDFSQTTFKLVLSELEADINDIEYKDTTIANYKTLTTSHKLAEYNEDTYENAVLYMVETNSKYIFIIVGYDSDSSTSVSLADIETILNTLKIEKE